MAETHSLKTAARFPEAAWLIMAALYFGLRSFPEATDERVAETPLPIGNGTFYIALLRLAEAGNVLPPAFETELRSEEGKAFANELLRWITGITRLAYLSPDGIAIHLKMDREHGLNLLELMGIKDKVTFNDVEKLGLALIGAFQFYSKQPQA